jgi:prolyl-tRNA synthetase
LEDLQTSLYKAAKQRLDEGITEGATYDEMKAALVNDEASGYPGAGLFLVPWKCNDENEDNIKEECKATIRCYPLDVNNAGMFEGKECFYSGEPANRMALFGRAF